MTVQVYENGVLIWYDTANKLDGVLRKVVSLGLAADANFTMSQLATDAHTIRTEINDAIAKKAEAFGVKKGVFKHEQSSAS
jgi:hypothetical protein